MTGNTVEFDLRLGVRIPLRDGACLSATLYVPRLHAGPSPCIFTLTPYIADMHHERGVYFATRGLPFLIVDVRGRGDSDGEFRPYIQEAADAYDVVEWLAVQPYCNGKVSMWGSSYLGYAQWAAAKERPPHLATIVPTAAPCLAVDFPMRNNVFYPFLVQLLTFVAGRASQAKIFSDGRFWSALFREWHESGESLRELDTLLGAPMPQLREWLRHPEPDAYWDAYNPTPAQYAQIQIPVLTITGSYDDDQPGALEHYKLHQRHAPPHVREEHYLVIGPWDHMRTAGPRAEFGGLEFGAASLVDVMQLHREWYAWRMQAGPKPEFLRKRVAYYVMGVERWRYADTLESVTARYQSYYLDSRCNANDVFSAGSLNETVGVGEADSYTYNPCDSTGPEVEAEARADGSSLVDQSVLLALRGRVLVYHSSPFFQDTEISGFFKLSAWISIDCPDTDFYVSVHEIELDGGSIRLSTDVLRARYRAGLRSPRLIQTRAPLRYDFEHFTFVSRQVARGHRLRLVIAPMGRLIEGTFAQRNYNAGGVVADESREQGRPVTVSLFHDAKCPSVLHVPLGRPELGDG